MTNGVKNKRLILDKRLILAKYNTITNLVDQKDRGLWERDCTITKTQASFKMRTIIFYPTVTAGDICLVVVRSLDYQPE